MNMNRYVNVAVWACMLIMLFPLLFLLIGGIYGICGYFRNDPAAPGLFEGIVKLFYVALFFCSNKRVLKRKLMFLITLGISGLVVSCLWYFLLFKGDWNLSGDASGWIIATIVCTLLPLNIFLHRLAFKMSIKNQI